MASNGAGLAGVDVSIWNMSGNIAQGDGTAANFVIDVKTAAHGRYSASGLPPSATGYFVCFDATSISVNNANGVTYGDRCYQDLPWGGPFPGGFGNIQFPLAMTGVAVGSGGINAVLDDFSTTSGTVTAAVGGAPLSGVEAYVYGSNGVLLGSQPTFNGTYSVGLAPVSAAPYSVCFDGSAGTGGSSTTGYASQCYLNVPWNSGAPPRSFDQGAGRGLRSE